MTERSNHTSIIIDMIDFLQTGQFGPISFGISREELQTHLGEAEDYGYSHNRNRPPIILKYGVIEFHFASPDVNRLWLIHMDMFETVRGASGLQLEPHWIQGNLPQSEVEVHLREANISWQEDGSLVDIGQLNLRLSSGVIVGLHYEDGLIAISYSQQLPPLLSP